MEDPFGRGVEEKLKAESKQIIQDQSPCFDLLFNIDETGA
jgi:hypothetical protein